MMGSGDVNPAAPQISLARATEGEYCQAALRARRNEFWWYFNGLAPYRGYSRPFADATGRWWYGVKPGFAWPADFFSPFDTAEKAAPRRRLLGWQFPVSAGAANSSVWLNVVHDLAGYGIESVAENKRRAVRRGLRELDVRVADPTDPATCSAACEVWNSHVVRTSWNKATSVDKFQAGWAELADWPGTTVLVAREKSGDPNVAAWLIARCIDDTVFVDTLASHTDRLAHRPNDAIVFACLVAAERAGLRHAHYSLCSNIASLEAFKASLGFVPHPFPARLQLRRPIGLALRWLRPATYRRLLGSGEGLPTIQPAENPKA
ncbi:MAG: hypothetical protein AABZ12_07980 [Planctomycetota bacterium]